MTKISKTENPYLTEYQKKMIEELKNRGISTIFIPVCLNKKLNMYNGLQFETHENIPLEDAYSMFVENPDRLKSKILSNK